MTQVGTVLRICLSGRFEKEKVSGETEYRTVGYMTVYHYYAYPDKIRPRIRSVVYPDKIKPRIRSVV